MVDKKKEENQVTAEVDTTQDEATQSTQSAESVEQSTDTEDTEETETETTEEATSETSETTSGPTVMERISGIVKKFFPDTEIDTSIELPAPVDAVLEKLLPALEGITQFHDDIYKVVEDYPEFGDFIIALRNGYAPYEAYVEYLEPEEPGEGAPDFEGSKAARERRSEMNKKRKEREAGVQKNIEGTLANLDQYVTDSEKTPEEAAALREHIANLFVDMADGTISIENIAKIDKGHTYDTVVKQKDEEIDQAFEDGKVNGRNEKIKKRREIADTGDSIPRMTGAGETNNKKKQDKFTSELEQMGNRKSVL